MDSTKLIAIVVLLLMVVVGAVWFSATASCSVANIFGWLPGAKSDCAVTTYFPIQTTHTTVAVTGVTTPAVTGVTTPVVTYASTTAAPNPLVAGSGCYDRSTAFDDDCNGDPICLDRHPVACNAGDVLKKVYYERDSTGTKIRYDYTCCTGWSSGAATVEHTAYDDDGNGSNLVLDRQNVDCGASGMNAFHLFRGGTLDSNGAFNQIRYDYSCINSKNAASSCRTVTTPMNAQCGVCLDRHILACNDGEAISDFQLVNGSGFVSAGKFQYQYKCCT